MTCVEFEASVEPYVDGELSVADTVAADAHRAACVGCAGLTERERDFRRLLRRQVRESAPAELVADVRRATRRRARVAGVRPWLLAPALAVAGVLVAILLLPASRPPAPLVAALVDKHIAYGELERPAELASRDGDEIAAWFRRRAGLRVPVPDYSPSGIQLVGARLSDVDERKAAYLLYEKGHTLLSVFMVRLGADAPGLEGRRVAYRGQTYLADERKGFRTVAWTDGQALYGLVSMLDYEALLECAERLRAERAAQTRL